MTQWAYTNNSRVHGFGDSFYAGQPSGHPPDTPAPPWDLYPGGLVDQILARQDVSFVPVSTSANVPSTLLTPKPSFYAPVNGRRGRCNNFTRYGHGGAGVVTLAAELQQGVYAFNPDILIFAGVTNDFGGGTATGPGSVFATNFAAILDGVHTNNANTKIICCTPAIRHEDFTAGHLFDNLDSWQGLTDMQTVISTRASFAIYCDWFADAKAYCAQNNTANVFPFRCTYDNLHPTPFGATAFLAPAVIRCLSFS